MGSTFKCSVIIFLNCLLLINVNSVDSAKILGILTTPFKGEALTQSYLMKYLAGVGHDVSKPIEKNLISKCTNFVLGNSCNYISTVR